MKTIPGRHAEDLDLHALRVLDVLFRERSLTRAAEALHTQQPALSKTLARLRRYFGDPLFVRVALHMEPTAKARLTWKSQFATSSTGFSGFATNKPALIPRTRLECFASLPLTRVSS
jgi:hypothetical protein